MKEGKRASFSPAETQASDSTKKSRQGYIRIGKGVGVWLFRWGASVGENLDLPRGLGGAVCCLCFWLVPCLQALIQGTWFKVRGDTRNQISTC